MTDVPELEGRLAGLVTRYGVPGASVSVLADGAVADAAAGVVNLRTGVEVRPDSPFMIQSVTKVWTATLVMQLVDDGLVGLDDPVRHHLRGFRTADEAASGRITVRHLLTHTAGFEGDIWAPTTDGPEALRAFVEQQVARAPQHTEPGALYSYCSAGMGVLGRLVEVVRGRTYGDALRHHLTDPLGVEGVVLDAGEALGHRTAIGHVAPRRGQAQRPLRTWAVLPSSNPAAGNQLAMPVRGLVELARLHLGDGVTPAGARLLSAQSARLMRSPHVPVPAVAGEPVQQGLGWRLTSSARVVEHSGDAPGCGAMLKLVPDRGVAVAVAANGGDLSGLVGELVDGLLDELADVAAPAAPRPPGQAPAERRTERYCGRYELRNRVAEVTADAAGRLWLREEERHEAVVMAELAGTRLEPRVTELRRIDGEVFGQLDRDGSVLGAVEFIGSDGRGRTRFLHDGQAAPRA